MKCTALAFVLFGLVLPLCSHAQAGFRLALSPAYSHLSIAPRVAGEHLPVYTLPERSQYVGGEVELGWRLLRRVDLALSARHTRAVTQGPSLLATRGQAAYRASMRGVTTAYVMAGLAVVEHPAIALWLESGAGLIGRSYQVRQVLDGFTFSDVSAGTDAASPDVCVGLRVTSDLDASGRWFVQGRLRGEGLLSPERGAGLFGSVGLGHRFRDGHP